MLDQFYDVAIKQRPDYSGLHAAGLAGKQDNALAAATLWALPRPPTIRAIITSLAGAETIGGVGQGAQALKINPKQSR